MKTLRQHTTDPTRFTLLMSYDEWEEIKTWLVANDIVWHALGANVIGFDDVHVSTMFALKWL